MTLLRNFRLGKEKEEFETVALNIEKGIALKGTNLWILVFAILIASLGLNVNSTAVIIGAMLVSPLMGPIIGLGFGMAVNDLSLLKNSLFAFIFSAGIGLATSTIYFSLSPLNDAHSEILSRTAPNIYDVLIAFFGGLAGMLATSSKLKGNVIPGVAIATALMPPLCTAGYGLATLNLEFFFGAFYLFLINSVFIALATLLTTRFLKFPYKHLRDAISEKKAKQVVWAVVLVTFIPSLYFGYDMIQKNKFLDNANRFIEAEANFNNDYILQKNIDAKHKTISLVFGGAPIDDKQIEGLKARLYKYGLDKSTLDIKQGFAYLQDNGSTERDKLTLAISEKEKRVNYLEGRLDSISNQRKIAAQLFKELKVNYTNIFAISAQKGMYITEKAATEMWFIYISSQEAFVSDQKLKIEKWLAVRLNTSKLSVHFEAKAQEKIK